MTVTRRWMAACLAVACLAFPAGIARAEGADSTEIPASNFEPSQEGSHGEVDQSALLNQATPVPQETIDINEIIAEEGMFSGDGAEGQASPTLDTADEYVSGDPNGVIDPTAAPTPVPTPVPTQVPSLADPNQIAGNNTSRRVDVNNVQFSALKDSSLGFTFNYPSNWVNIPGVRTVCFHEPVEQGDFPARIAISVKTMSHSVENDVLSAQLEKFMRVISKQYVNKTFQVGKANKKDTFFRHPAYSNTYMAYYGDMEIKGFVIGCAVGKNIVVGHFCSTYEDYAPMKQLMRYMFNSAQPLR